MSRKTASTIPVRLICSKRPSQWSPKPTEATRLIRCTSKNRSIRHGTVAARRHLGAPPLHSRVGARSQKRFPSAAFACEKSTPFGLLSEEASFFVGVRAGIAVRCGKAYCGNVSRRRGTPYRDFACRASPTSRYVSCTTGSLSIADSPLFCVSIVELFHVH